LQSLVLEKKNTLFSHSNYYIPTGTMIKIQIFTDRNLRVTLARGWSEDLLIKGKIATLTGRRFTVEVPPDCTIAYLKKVIEDVTGIQQENQELRKGKTSLKDERTLDHYFIRENMTLLLINNGDPVLPTGAAIQEEGDYQKIKERPKPTETIVLSEEKDAKKLNSDNREWWQREHVLSGPNPITTAANTSSVGANVEAKTRHTSQQVFSSSSSSSSNSGGGRVGGRQHIDTGYDENSVEHRRELMRRAQQTHDSDN
jgi:hypothetical protein